jgi:hypothetical protein
VLAWGGCCGRDTETFNQRVLAETDRSAVERERKQQPEARALLHAVRTGIHDNSRCVQAAYSAAQSCPADADAEGEWRL